MVRFFLPCLWLVGLVSCLSKYDKAMSIISTLPLQYLGLVPLYDDDSIDDNLYIPQFDNESQTYQGIQKGRTSVTDQFQQEVVPLLVEGSEENDPDALVTLADILVFGNYSTVTDYTRAREYYERTVAIKPNGHAYFMLGFLYSTGAFGEIPIDEQRAMLNYHFGVENGDLNAILVMANKYLTGTGKPVDCNMAKYYYARLAHHGMKYMRDNNLATDDHELSYNIKLVDFNGGLYGPKLSESPSSVFKRGFTSSKNTFNEFNLDIHDHDYVDSFFAALEYYYGDYFINEDHELAFETAHYCASLGQHRYGANKYSFNHIDKFFIGRCQTLLGTLYFKGHGTEKNFDRAHHWFRQALELDPDAADAYWYLGKLYLMSPLTDGAVSKEAANFYKKGVELKSPKAALGIGTLLMDDREFDNGVSLTEGDEATYKFIRKAAFGGNTEALYFWVNYMESGGLDEDGNSYSCENLIVFYKSFIEKLQKFYFPHLNYAFQEFKYGDFKNSLIGYLIAAEQGLENAQVSAAYLLFQMEPLVLLTPRKTFAEARMAAASKYLEKASAQRNVDATILLGDIYFQGVESANVSVDHNKAFTYYNKAAQLPSSQGCYNLGYMYEYGLGPVNNSVDYFLAKRYYDLSLERKKQFAQLSKITKVNTVPINLALLRLRLKFLFNRKKYSQSSSDGSGWLSAFNNLRLSNEETESTVEETEQQRRAQAQHEGSSYYLDEDYELGDYIVMCFMFAFFIFFFLQGIQRQLRRLGQRRNGANEENDDNAGRFNFEFHFVAI